MLPSHAETPPPLGYTTIVPHENAGYGRSAHANKERWKQKRDIRFKEYEQYIIKHRCRDRTQLAEAMRKPVSTLYADFKRYPVRAQKLERLMSVVSAERDPETKVPPFYEFRDSYIGTVCRFCHVPHGTPDHQREWFEAIQEHDKVLILQPPEHGKTLFCEDWLVWLMCQDPGIQAVYMSKTQTKAEKSLARIARLLTDGVRKTEFSIERDFGPFKPAPDEKHLPWKSTHLFPAGGGDPGTRDAMLEALGEGNQIQGNRTDVVVWDDTMTLENQGTPDRRDKQLSFLEQEVYSRLPPSGGKVVIIGTRVRPDDNYAYLMGSGDYHVLVQPAIKNYSKGEVLWPEHWSFDHLEKRRKEMRDRAWSLVYQQVTTGISGAPFTPEVLEKCEDPSSGPGFAPAASRVVMGVDPATTGNFAIVVLAAQGEHRHIVDVINKRDVGSPLAAYELVEETVKKYGVARVLFEKSSQQGGLVRDLVPRLRPLGCRIDSWDTRAEKWDEEIGVLRVAARMEAGRYSIPANAAGRVYFADFAQQLMAWMPHQKQTQDMVMALWLADLCSDTYGGPIVVKQNPNVPRYLRKRGEPPKWLTGWLR